MTQVTQTLKQEQLELSQELLYLLQWLSEHHMSTLKRLIDSAVKNGFKKRLVKENEDKGEELSQQELLYYSVGEFLSLLDALLLETLYEQNIKQAQHKKMLPLLDKIDVSEMDAETILDSLEFTKPILLANDQKHHAQEILLKELLKRWQPHKKTVIN
jgi:hypothetical protein